MTSASATGRVSRASAATSRSPPTAQAARRRRRRSHRTRWPLPPPPTTSPDVNGSVSGNPFVLGDDTVITLNADGTGSFSGTDLNGAGLIKGTYRCN